MRSCSMHWGTIVQEEKIEFIYYVDQSPVSEIDATTTPREGSTLNRHGYCLEAIAMGKNTNRRKRSMISDEHRDTAVSNRSVISGRRFWAEFTSSGMSAHTVKTGHFVLSHSAGLAYMLITTPKTSRLRSTLSFSMHIPAVVVSLDRQVFECKERVIKEFISGCGIHEGEGNAIPPNSFYAAIDNVFDIGRLQDFPKRHQVENTASRRGTFDLLAMNDKWASVFIIILQTPYAFSWRTGCVKRSSRGELSRTYVGEMRERWNIV
ncbi:hypothetical protein EVAR_76220_1 [Eumeta japonica]|uniref:Uncharacterized protein n=1 Tax=Eumeta variegata TaxID=151549 RepID=A0A4C1UQ72_EUMVA|nr:hypothetical protein EVAR_76220_1 [Eumeta japonica]